MKCIMCNRSRGSIIYGIKQNYLVCSECLKKYKPKLKSKKERVTVLQQEIYKGLRKYLKEEK